MKNQELRSSLIKSGVILTLCIFFIYAFAADDSGGVTGTIASIFSGILFLIGIVLAVAVSVLVMFAIYFGILYLYNKETCKKTFDEFKPQLTATLASCKLSCPSRCHISKETETSASEETLRDLQTKQDTLEKKLADIQSSVNGIETTLSTVSSSVVIASGDIAKVDERITLLAEEIETRVTTENINNISAALEKELSDLKNAVSPLGTTLSQLTRDVAELQKHAENDDGDDIHTLLDTALSPVRQDIETIQKQLAEQSTRAADDQEESPDGENQHRILTYFENKSDENKFVQLVAEAVAKGMTYAEAGEYLNDSLSTAASEVIADHPSLTKDYIRTIRQAQ